MIYAPVSGSSKSFSKVNNSGRGYPTLQFSSQTPVKARGQSAYSVVALKTSKDATHACVAVRRSVIRDVVPCHRRGLAQQAPVLCWIILNTHDPGFETTDTRSQVRAALKLAFVSEVKFEGFPRLSTLSVMP